MSANVCSRFSAYLLYPCYSNKTSSLSVIRSEIVWFLLPLLALLLYSLSLVIHNLSSGSVVVGVFFLLFSSAKRFAVL